MFDVYRLKEGTDERVKVAGGYKKRDEAVAQAKTEAEAINPKAKYDPEQDRHSAMGGDGFRYLFVVEGT